MTDARREMFGYLAETAGVLASPRRIELIDLLAHGERSVEELSEASRLSIAHASHHLQQLPRPGAVSRRPAGAPNARGMPVPARRDALPKRPERVACCRGPYGVRAYKGAEILRPAGSRARRLEGGFMEWRRAGLPLVRADAPARLET